MRNIKSSIVIVISVIVLFIIISRLTIREKNNHIDINDDNESVATTAKNDVNENFELTEKKELQGISIPGWETITISANEKTQKIDFYNPMENAGLYYLTFELKLFDKFQNCYESIYKSDLIKPGQHLKNIELKRELPAEKYDAIIHVQPYTMDEFQRPTNNVDMKVELIVK